MIKIEFYEVNERESISYEIDDDLIYNMKRSLLGDCLSKTNCKGGWLYDKDGHLCGADESFIINIVKRVCNVSDEIALGILFYFDYATVHQNDGYKWFTVNQNLISDVNDYIKYFRPYEDGNTLNKKIRSVVIHNNIHQQLPLKDLLNLIEIEYTCQPVFD